MSEKQMSQEHFNRFNFPGAAVGVAVLCAVVGQPALAQDQAARLEMLRRTIPERNVSSDQPDTLRQIDLGADDLGVSDSDQPDQLEALLRSIPAQNRRVFAEDQPESIEAIPTAPMTGAPMPPLPEVRSDAIATVTPLNNQLSVMLVNETGAMITYEVIGNTPRRTLMPGETANLQGIPLPSTITAVRQDSGLLDISAAAPEAGMLTVSLTAEPVLDDTQGVLRIHEDGLVFVN